jgi:hypothetical protein
MSTPGSSSGTFVSESALDFLLLEATREYLDKGEAGRRALDRMGYQVGAKLAERYTRDRPRFADSTEAVLFVCKEFWPLTFGKRVDSLKTNNKGTFVLTDASFRWTRNIRAVGASAEAGESARRAVATEHARVPAGMLTGFLTALGYPAEVVADAKNAPAVVFTVRL